MTTQGKGLFRLAAIFNFAVAAGLLLGRPVLTPLLRMDPASGTNAMLIDLAAALIAVFGYAYARVAADPQTYRPYIALGVIGKVLVVAVAAVHFLAGSVAWPLPALASGDLLFAGLFLLYLRRSSLREVRAQAIQPR